MHRQTRLLVHYLCHLWHQRATFWQPCSWIDRPRPSFREVVASLQLQLNKGVQFIANVRAISPKGSGVSDKGHARNAHSLHKTESHSRVRSLTKWNNPSQSRLMINTPIEDAKQNTPRFDPTYHFEKLPSLNWSVTRPAKPDLLMASTCLIDVQKRSLHVSYPTDMFPFGSVLTGASTRFPLLNA